MAQIIKTAARTEELGMTEAGLRFRREGLNLGLRVTEFCRLNAAIFRTRAVQAAIVLRELCPGDIGIKVAPQEL